ncbi:MAG: FKBP-type peptidyl-prolyl cis-trans isomerase, partial [Chitinophagaceae bacterium]
MVFKSKLDSASYAFGLAMASNLKAGGLEGLNYDLLTKGLKDAFNK